MSDFLTSLAADPRALAGQVFGLIPMLLSFWVYIFNDRKKVIAMKAATDLLWALHYFLIGASSGCVINLINTGRDIVFYQKGKKWASYPAIPVFFCAVSAAGTLLSWEGARSLLPLLGTTLAIIGFWCSEPDKMRRFSLPGITLWLIYSVVSGAVSAVVCNVFSILSMAVAEYNYRRRRI